MTVPHYALLAARALRRTDPNPIVLGGDRERGLLSVERALGARRRASRRGWKVGLAAAVAAAACGWLGVRELGPSSQLPAAATWVSVVASPLRDGASFLDSTGEVPLGPGVRLLVGGRIATAPGGGARLLLSTGTHLDLDGLTTLTLQSQDILQRFALAQGSLTATVAKLAPTERFVIDTPDAQVEVRGTQFRLEVLPVSRACGDGNRTRLEVTDGVVEVRSSRLLARVLAGQYWPSDCDLPASTATGLTLGVHREDSGAPASTASGVAKGQVTPATSVRAARPRRSSGSSIAEQNALFQRGVLAQRQGDSERALAAYAELLERFPSSPLAENATVARFRLFISADPGRARRAAAAYLARYPRGFARREAQRIAEGQ